MVSAYDTYATAIRIAQHAHNSYRRMRFLHGDDDPRTKRALTKAANTATYREDAKQQYRLAKVAAKRASRGAA